MIATIRNQFNKSGKVILWIVIASMAGGMILSLRNTTRKADTIATVNGIGIDRADYQAKVRQENEYIALLRKQFGTGFEALLGKAGKTEERVLNQLVTQKLLESAAGNMHMQVGHDQIVHKLGDQQFVMQALADIVPPEAFYGRNGINMEAVKHFLARKGVSDADLEEIIAAAIKNNLLSSLVGTASYVTGAQLRDAYSKKYVAKKYGIATVDINKYIDQAKKDAPTISEQDLQAFYIKHSADYMVPEKRSAKVWSFEIPDYNLPVSAKEITDYYNKHRKDYIDKPESVELRLISVPLPEKADEHAKASTERKAEDILQNAKKDAELFKKDGKTVTVTRKDKDNALVSAAFALAKDGDISGVIKTKDGFAVAQRVTRKEATYKKQDAVTDEITQAVKKEKFPKQFNLDGQRIISQAADDASYLTKFVESKKGQLQTITDLTQDGSQKANKIFGLKEKGRAFYVEGLKGYIVELTDTKKAYLPKLAELKDKVTADYYKDEAHDLMDKALHEALIKLNKGGSFDAIAKDIGAQVEKTDWIDPVKAEAYAELTKKEVPVDRLKLLINKGSAVEELTEKHGYLIDVLDTKPIDQKDFEAKKEQLESAADQEQLQTLFAAFIEQLKKNGKIEVNAEVQRYYKA